MKATNRSVALSSGVFRAWKAAAPGARTRDDLIPK
jgi:hypothetical protein